MRVEITFEQAMASLQKFLKENGHPENVFWVFRGDLWQRPTDVLVRYPPPPRNLVLARKVFTEGCDRGFIAIDAIATTHDQAAATVWFSKFPRDQVQGLDAGVKLSLAQPMPHATLISPWRWWSVRFRPRFRQYQRYESWIKTKEWATAAVP